MIKVDAKKNKHTKAVIYTLSQYILTNRQIEKIRKLVLSDDINLSYMHRICSQHDIGALIYSNICKYLPELIEPNELGSLFKENYQVATVNNMLLLKELASVLALLKESQISFALIKGLALTKRLYGGINIKPSRDIDILVQKKDLEAIKSLFIAQDYQISRDSPLIDGLVLQRRGAASSPSVEFETELVCGYPLRNIDYQEDIWGRLKTEEIDTVEFTTLSYENELIYICLHFYHHFYCFVFFLSSLPRFKWLCDVDRFITKYSNQIDWDDFIDRCKEYGIVNIIYYVFSQAKRYLKTEIPYQVNNALRPCLMRRWMICALSGDSLLELETKHTRYTNSYFRRALLYFLLLPTDQLVTRLWLYARPVFGIKGFLKRRNLTRFSLYALVLYIISIFVWMANCIRNILLKNVH